MHDFELASLGFSDPCSIRVSSVARSVDLYANDSCGRVSLPGLVLLLPGRETVAQVAPPASENGVKNARIEANGYEPQIDELQEDTNHMPDTGGENRTQFLVWLERGRMSAG
jgi:hypothetical protein